MPITRAVKATLPVRAVPVRLTPLACCPMGACPTGQRSQHAYGCAVRHLSGRAGEGRAIRDYLQAGKGSQQVCKMTVL